MLKKKKEPVELAPTPAAVKQQPVQDEYILPLIAVKGAVFGPEINTSFDFGKPNSVRAIEHAPDSSNIIAIAMQKNPEGSISAQELSRVCCLADIKDITRITNDVLRVNLYGLSRVQVMEIIREEPFILARVRLLLKEDDTEDTKTLAGIAREKFLRLLQLTGTFDDVPDGVAEMPAEKACASILSAVPIPPHEYFDIMSEQALMARLEKTVAWLSKAVSTAEIEMELENKLMLQFTSDQRSRYLREKKNLISRELKDEGDEEELDEYREKLQALPIQEEYRNRLMKEMYRLETSPPGSQEAAVIQTYLDCILDLPWNEATSNDFGISGAVEILNAEHCGLEKVKDRVIEYIAVMKRTKSLKSPILCLVGPPGVGKTSVAKSVANATQRKFVRISLGGMHDEAEIRGHRKTYVGAMPGRIITGLRQVQSKNPVFLLDEIDKLSRDVKGDPASALLEALDPEQNATFTDTYIEIPFDLSDVMFITTANSISTIPAPLLDRLEVIELSGYMPNEKVSIANEHLIPKQLKANGIGPENLSIPDDVLYEIIHKYTRETGVRQLERSIAALCRKTTKAIEVDGEESLEVTVESLSELLGKEIHTFDTMKDELITGVVNGLAWTSAGGDTLVIESAACEGSGKVELTGNLGDVMKESARTALGFLRSHAEAYGLSDVSWGNLDIHLHVPEGGVPKDGPSAGITIATCLLSMLTGRGVSQKIAMTGEITLTGRVLPIGGLREKLLAASRAGITSVVIPKENEKDLPDLPADILASLTIKTAGTIHDVFGVVFGELHEGSIV